MHFICLIIAIILEVLGTTNMKLSQGFTKILPSILMFVFYGLSFAFLTLALKKIDMSIAYAIWSGVGTALVTIVGIVLFKESITVLKLISIGLIILGVVGLHLMEGK
ncbi:MAG: multidrug efflux SMR transporter [Thermodesulfobacteriaceae bacterium]|nr:multidrug efflux SMR transporter [Thermodesulfobacteriaceae bacterium]MCX8042355.1 multidrug efflux SMR transporter [Thermodesulfobacteriaceae bacterium]MDW8135327.1 multidrug efflux SMR transporter [Thermodesulfobacterium sp.]